MEQELTFQVGEKVVVCDAEIPFSGDCYPNPNDFTFTTIKEVRPNGNVVIEEGLVYRPTRDWTGECKYFRITRVKNDSKTYYLNGKGYRTPNNIVERFNTFLPTYLFKFDQSWQDKADRIQRAYEEAEARKQEYLKQEERKNVFRNAYQKEIAPLEERFQKACVKAFRVHICGNCIYNRNGYCVEFKHDINKENVTTCSGFDVPKEDK